MRGREAVGPLYAALGQHIFESERGEWLTGEHRDTREFVEPILAEAGLPADLADALDDEGADEEIRAETAEALALTGKDVGTPILHFRPARTAWRSSARSSAGCPATRTRSSSGTTSSRWRPSRGSPS